MILLYLIPIFIFAIVGGIVLGIVEHIKAQRSPITETIEPPGMEETPYYVVDKLAAYDAQIESLNKLLEELNHAHYSEKDELKRAKIRKQQADIMVKLATIEEKAYKLRDKFEMD